MKKLVSMLLVAVILFNFIFCNHVYAEDLAYKQEGEEVEMSGESLNKLLEEGKAKYADSDTNIVFSFFKSLFGAIAGIISAFLNIFPALISAVMSMCVETGFSIEKTVFGEIAIFDVNYFNDSDQYTIGTGDHQKIVMTKDVTKSLRTSIAKFYYIVRLIALAISLLVLIYVGIRMALSTVSSDKAKYKKMLVGWIEGIIILFVMQYIMVAIFSVGKIFQDITYDMKCILEESDAIVLQPKEGETVEVENISFEASIYDTVTSSMLGKAGWNYAMYSIIYWVLIYIQTKFFIMYFKRVIAVGFFVLISPLITVTYPIDKLGDGKAQAFSVWLNELMMNVFIQPIHAIIYLIFMFTANQLAVISPWIGLAFLLMLTKIEKIILQLFNLKRVTSLIPIGEHRKG